jgi:hypothetical protein
MTGDPLGCSGIRRCREKAKEREHTRQGSRELWEEVVVVVLIVVVQDRTPESRTERLYIQTIPLLCLEPREQNRKAIYKTIPLLCLEPPSARSTHQIQWRVPYYNPAVQHRWIVICLPKR